MELLAAAIIMMRRRSTRLVVGQYVRTEAAAAPAKLPRSAVRWKMAISVDELPIREIVRDRREFIADLSRRCKCIHSAHRSRPTARRSSDDQPWLSPLVCRPHSGLRGDSGLRASDQDGGPRAAPRCLVLFGGSESGRRNEAPEIEGKIPRELRGSLYRNGPGVFDHGGLRKPHLLDGDGLVLRLSLADGTAHYQNAFVRTPKFIAEEKAATFHFTTCSMRPSGGLIPSRGGSFAHCQAGVTVYPFKDLLYAFDEISPAFAAIRKRWKRWVSSLWAIRPKSS
jgi:hypothetical protein